MRVFLSVASFQPSYGGPARSVSRLATALAELGIEVGVWAPDQSAADTEFLDKASGVKRLTGDAAGALAQFGTADLIHDNGIWLPHNHRLACLARKHDIPRVVSIRGMLEPWALRHKRWKKRLAWHAYQQRDLCSASILHATAASEADQVRSLGLKVPVRVISNGVDLSPARLDRPKESGIKTALFLGRLHPKKGLPLLVEAWAKTKPAGWRMRVVGPDEAGHRAEIEALVGRAGLTGEWSFEDSLDGLAKSQAFDDASLFVLPTHSENFGMAIAEALAHGLPVLTTHGAPWEKLHAEDCGWWTPVTVDGISAALAEATKRPVEELQKMGQRGRLWMQRDFSWTSVAHEMQQVYTAMTSAP